MPIEEPRLQVITFLLRVTASIQVLATPLPTTMAAMPHRPSVVLTINDLRSHKSDGHRSWMEPPPTLQMGLHPTLEAPEGRRDGASGTVVSAPISSEENGLREEATSGAVSAGGLREGTGRPGHAEEAEAAVEAAEAELEAEHHAPAAAGQHNGSLEGGNSAFAGNDASASSPGGSGAVAGPRGPAALLCCCCARVVLALIPTAVKAQAAKRMVGRMTGARTLDGKRVGISGMRRSTRSLQPSLATRTHAVWRSALERLAVFSLTALGVTERAARTFNLASQASRPNQLDGGGTAMLSPTGRRGSAELGFRTADASAAAGGSVAAANRRGELRGMPSMRGSLEGDAGRTASPASASSSAPRPAAGGGREAAAESPQAAVAISPAVSSGGDQEAVELPGTPSTGPAGA